MREMCVATNEYLYEQYWYAGKTCNEIAIDIGRDPKRVWEWMREANIPVKPRGHDERQRFKKGHESPFTGRRHSEETKKKISDICKKDGRIPGYGHKVPYWKGKTGEQHPNWKGGCTPERQRVYSSDEWKECVKKVWHRDDAICQCCFKDHRNIDRINDRFDIHHIISFSVEKYRCDVGNLILLCYDCHKWVHSKKNKYKLFLQENF